LKVSHIDLNCDLGEGAANDAAIMPCITSANIACGGHAGDERTMHETIQLALRHRVAVGAHPGFEDREFFGRRGFKLSPVEIHELVTRQLRHLKEIAADAGTRLNHVKPHGALYNLAARDRQVADAIAVAVREIDPRLILVGLSGSCLINAAQNAGLPFAREVFADRTYRGDGSLTPRTQPRALIAEPTQSLDQILQLVQRGRVITTDGSSLPMSADTICLHGDAPDAAVLAEFLHRELPKHGVTLRRMGED
jgi:UPF0271 protein